MVAMPIGLGAVFQMRQAVIAGVDLGEAVQGVHAVTEGHHRWRCRETEGRKQGEGHSYAETQARPQCFKHASSLLLVETSRKLAVLHKMRYQRPYDPAATPKHAPMTEAAELPPSVLVADIGGTNARFAIADPATLALSHITKFLCAEHRSLGTAAFGYLRAMQPRPRYAAIAVAAPVTGEEIKLTNSPWSFARSEVCHAAGLDGLLVLNDFQALALSLPHLDQQELHQIGGAKAPLLATKAVLGPGTGIGVSALVWGGADWLALPSEGGHISLAARSRAEFDLVARLGAGRDRVSVERVLSGPGIADLYLAMAAEKGREVEPLIPNDVLERGLEGSDDLAVEALALFVSWLGAFAGDVALLFGARGGIYIGGGIAPKIVKALSAGSFRAAFEDKGRMRSFVAPIPVHVIMAQFAALKGAAAGLRASLLRGGAGLSVPSP